ncbi:PucR family transcriptional regulator [Rhodococcus qingshengii]|nr:PucR family transcriptional regulator [Rhodococcus qingshengii]
MLLVREFKKLEYFSNVANLVAGEKGLNNQISNVTVMEAPDFPNWVSGGEFVLSTFYSIKDDQDVQVKIIRQLATKGIGALGIKVNRYIETIHPTVLQEADKLSLPVFSISREAKFRDLIKDLSAELIHRQNESHRETVMFQDKIMTLSFKGASLETLCQEIENHVGSTCAILTPQRNVIAGKIAADIQGNHDNIANPQVEIDRILDQLAINDKLLDDSSIEYRHDPFVTVGCYVKEKLICLMVFSGVNSWGVRESVLSKHASTAIGMSLLEGHIKDNVERKVVSSFVDEIVFKGIDINVFPERANFFGWKIYDLFQAIVVKIIDEISLSRDKHQILLDRIARQIRLIFPSVLMVTKKNELIVLVSLEVDSNFNYLDYYKSRMNELFSGFFYQSTLEKQIRIGFGTIFNDATLLPISYRQANSLAKMASNKNGLLWYAPDHLLELFLLHSKDQVERRQIRNNVVDKLVGHDLKHGTELFKTLKAFLSTDSLEEASEKLFIHSNTMRNRLSKVFDVTGINPNKTTDRLILLTALIENI